MQCGMRQSTSQAAVHQTIRKSIEPVRQISPVMMRSNEIDEGSEIATDAVLEESIGVQ